MDNEHLKMWMDAVQEHNRFVDKMMKEETILKQHFEQHLAKFFEWGSIVYDKDFHKIELYYEYGHSPVFKVNIGELGIPFIIRADYDDKANRIVIVELYPFGLPVGEFDGIVS